LAWLFAWLFALLPVLFTGPLQQAVRVERVVDELALAERKADACAALAYRRLRLGDLRRRAAVFVAQVLDDVLAFRAHLRVQFKRVHDPLGANLVTEVGKRALQRREADRAPRARDIGNVVDS